jgi:predicted RNA methylase
LYEAFFRYTGGNTIGQYFTPRHITKMMVDICGITRDDVVLDPACGTGGFLVACMDRILREHHLSRAQVVQVVQQHLIGFEDEPVTAALCVANMILRGDGSTGVHRGDSLKSPSYPVGQASVVLMNPPFPHGKTKTPPELFVERALEGLQQRGRLAVIMPRSSLGKREKAHWRASILAHNTLDGVIVLPDELFAPYASSYTAVVLITKGVRHAADHSVFFARIENDGLRRRKNVRVPQEGEQLTLAIKAFQENLTIAGFCGWKKVDPSAGWDSGFYIPARPLSEAQVEAQSAALARSSASFVVSHAPELLREEDAAREGAIVPRSYGTMKKPAKKRRLGLQDDTIGGRFDIYWGQKNLHNKMALAPGPSLVISSSGFDNGCYGFFDYDDVIEPPFVTVPSTGSIGRAHVQKWPCGVTDDCLILVPKKGTPPELLYVAAAVVRQERWRFNYGRKITPDRIEDFPLPSSDTIRGLVRHHVESAMQIEKLALAEAEDTRDAEIARKCVADIAANPDATVRGEQLEEKLEQWLIE